MTAHSPMKSLNVSRSNKGKYRSRGEQMARMWEQSIKDGPGVDILLGGQDGLKLLYELAGEGCLSFNFPGQREAVGTRIEAWSVFPNSWVKL